MTIFDYVVIAIVGLSIVLGLFRGMVKEILSLANWVIAFWLANRYGSSLVVYLDFAEGLSEPIKALLGCAGTFLASMIVGSILIGLLGRVVSAAGLSFADRGLGGVFGAARGCFVVLVLVTAAGFTSLPTKPFWQNAMLWPYTIDVMQKIKPHLPESVSKWVRY